MEAVLCERSFPEIFLTDLYEGSKRAAVYAKAGDASEFLNQWLGKYGSIEEIQQLVKECL